MPKPHKGEDKKDYIGRCMGNPEMSKKFDDTKQRAAVCYSYWDKRLEESMTFKQYLTETNYTPEKIASLAKDALDELAKIGEAGKLPSVYKDVEEYLYDFYPDLPWEADAQLQAMKLILKDPKFKEVNSNWKEKLKFDFDKELRDAIKELQKEIHG